MEKPKSLRYIDQLALFKMRGVSGIRLDISLIHAKTQKEQKQQKRLIYQNHYKPLKTISFLGYYSLKNYVEPFEIHEKYEDLSFSNLVARFYRDKRLRQAVLHAIEDIELTLDTKISHVLGEKYGPTGYTNFLNWCQKFERNEFIRDPHNSNGKFMDRNKLLDEQNKFLQTAKRKMHKSASLDMKKFRENNPNSTNPPIWLLINELTLGESIHLLKLMSKNNRKKIASFFETDTRTLISWLDCINLIRNICCHNGDLADIKLITTPQVPDEYKRFLLRHAGNYTNRFALPLCVIFRLIGKINNKYQVDPIYRSIKSLIGFRANPKYYGFASGKKLEELFKYQSKKNKESYTSSFQSY